MNVYVSRDGQQYGPYPIEDVRAHMASGSLLPTDHAFCEGMTDWAPLEQVLASAANQSPSVAATARPASAHAKPSKTKKKNKSKAKKKDKDTASGIGGLLYKYRAVIAVIVIIATGIYLYNEHFKSAGPSQGEDPGAAGSGQEEDMKNPSDGQGGGPGGSDPTGPGNPGDPSGL